MNRCFSAFEKPISSIPLSHLAPLQPGPQAQWPGETQIPPFKQPLGRQMAGWGKINTLINTRQWF